MPPPLWAKYSSTETTPRTYSIVQESGQIGLRERWARSGYSKCFPQDSINQVPEKRNRFSQRSFRLHMIIDAYFLMVKNSLDQINMRQMSPKKRNLPVELRKMLEKNLGPTGCVEKCSSEQLLHDSMCKLERSYEKQGKKFLRAWLHDPEWARLPGWVVL